MSDESPKRSEALSMMNSTESENDQTPRRSVLRNAAAGALAVVGLSGAASALKVEPECTVGTGVINGTCYEIECCTDQGTCAIVSTSDDCADDAPNYDCCEEFCYGESC